MISYKKEEIKKFRKEKLDYYLTEAEKNPCKDLLGKKYQIVYIWGKPKKHPNRKNKVSIKNPPLELVSEMLNNGEYHESEQGYIYIIYKGYRAYLHRLILLNAGYNIPKGFSIHHIDRNRKNNNINNLQIIDSIEHLKLHSKSKV